MAWLGLYGFAWNDYETEAQPAFDALAHGHVLEFLRLAPAYGGSLVERAPFALLPGLWGGGALAVYRMVALPCLLAAAALGVWLCARMRAAGRADARAGGGARSVRRQPADAARARTRPSRGTARRAACAWPRCSPAGRERPRSWAGVLLGLAIANKEWALLAAGPVLLGAARAGRAGRAALRERGGRRRGGARAARARRLGRVRGEHAAVAATAERDLPAVAGSGGSSATTAPLVHGLFGAPSPATARARRGRARSAIR